MKIAIGCHFALMFATGLLLPGSLQAQASRRLTEGVMFDLDAGHARISKLDTLPYVESDYTKRFKFDSYENPKLKELRERYRLEEVIASGKDEFEKQVILMDWVHHRFKRFGHPSASCRGALDILKAIDDGHTFFCAQYADLLASCAASLGWVDRTLALRRH